MDQLTRVREAKIWYSQKEAAELIRAEIRGHLHSGEDPDAARILFLIGSHGEAKTRSLQQIAQEMELAYASFHAGAIDSQDNTGLQQIVKGSTVHNKPAHLPIFSAPKSKSGYGLFVFEEFGTNDNNEFQNQARQLSEGRLGELVKHPNWILAATSNPEGAEYSTVNKLDEALVSRLVIIPIKLTAAEKLNYWRHKAGQKMFEKLYWFLAINQTLLETADARSWYNLGKTLERMEAANCSAKAAEQAVRIVAGDAAAAAYQQFLIRGNDPDAYPIGGEAILFADAATLKTYVARIKKWMAPSKPMSPARMLELLNTKPCTQEELDDVVDINKPIPQLINGSVLIQATKYDLVSALMRGSQICMRDTEVSNVAAILQVIGADKYADMVFDVIQVVRERNAEAAAALTNKLSGTKAGNRLIEVFDKVRSAK